MKFRTEITVKTLSRKIEYSSHIFTIGSCFAENISERMRRAKFRVISNPTGILFNPASIAAALSRYAKRNIYGESELTEADGKWFSYDAHTSLDGHTAGETLHTLNEAVEVGYGGVSEADTVVITFGTAWVYILNATNRVVANCHKQPGYMFERKLLTVDDIVKLYVPLLDEVLKNKHVIITVSPVRHIADGLDGNAVSKSILRLAVEELAVRYDNVDYFPAYEIMNDDLRDYRFYDEDLVHPNKQAVEYIWEHFVDAVLSERARQLLPKAESIVAAYCHRPFDRTSDAYRNFCRKGVEMIDSLSEIDFSVERNFFKQFYE